MTTIQQLIHKAGGPKRFSERTGIGHATARQLNCGLRKPSRALARMIAAAIGDDPFDGPEWATIKVLEDIWES